VIAREAVEGAGVEGLVEIGFGEAVVGQLQLVDLGTLGALERIELGPAGAQETVGVDQLENADLLLVAASTTVRTGPRLAISAKALMIG
jgi:hypothetical protein